MLFEIKSFPFLPQDITMLPCTHSSHYFYKQLVCTFTFISVSASLVSCSLQNDKSCTTILGNINEDVK